MRHPKVRISDIEARLGSRFTADTINSLMKIYPKHQFVWLMGADNLQQIDRWQNWRSIMHTLRLAYLPVRVINWLSYRARRLNSSIFSVIDVAKLKLGYGSASLVLYQPTDEPCPQPSYVTEPKTMIVATASLNTN